MNRGMLFTVSACLVAVLVLAQDEETPTISVNDLMVTIVTPATNTLWGIEDPQTDAEWQVFIEAADAVIDAARIIKVGGTGPNDNEWAANAEWDAFADQLIQAGIDARAAAENRDVEAMYTAGEVLYPPCEDCHNQYHPGVAPYQ